MLPLNLKIFNGIKAKLKKIGVLAVMLVSLLIFAPRKGEGQKKSDTKVATEECRDDKTVCIKCGGACVVLCCAGDDPEPAPALSL